MRGDGVRTGTWPAGASHRARLDGGRLRSVVVDYRVCRLDGDSGSRAEGGARAIDDGTHPRAHGVEDRRVQVADRAGERDAVWDYVGSLAAVDGAHREHRLLGRRHRAAHD